MAIYVSRSSPAFLSDFETYSIIFSMYGLNSSLISNCLALGRVSGLFTNSFVIISLMKGETVEGRGAGSLSVINF
jgi:hypothetical protein